MPTNEAITRHHDDPPGSDPYVPGRRPSPSPIRIVEYEERWPADFERVAERVREALGPRVLELHHVGSTSVPGLPAKPVIDVDLVVADPADEQAYIPALESRGFVHIIREPWWHEHRLLKHRDPITTHLHVFGPDCPEVIRHLMFREWLLERPDERETYAEAKRAAAREMNARPGGGTGMEYNRHKEPVVRAIYDRMFLARGLLDGRAQSRPLPVLSDGNVLLRAAQERDLPAIEAGIHDPDVLRWIGPPEGTAREVLARNEERWAQGSPTFSICEPDGSCVGKVWMNVRDADRSTGFIGYWLLPVGRGRGLATSAVRLLGEWAVRELGIRSLRIVTAPDNARSQRLAERCGFRRVLPSPEDGQVVFALDAADR